jgi:hypothetical protein
MTSLPSPDRVGECTHSDSVDDDLATALGRDRADQWRLARGPQPVAVWVERIAGQPIAAVLTTRRPATLATKIAFVWRAAGVGESDDALRRLLDSVVSDSVARGDVAVKWQHPVASNSAPVDPAPLDFAAADSLSPENLGFTRMRSPYASAAGTEGVDGYILWHRPIVHTEPPYYSQTSSFTCGAVTALLASEIRGSGGFDLDANLRDQELDFWRQASNFPSCEPIGLAVALRESLDDADGTSPIEVFLDSDGPVLLEAYTERFDRSFREELQANSLRRALASDIPVHRQRLSIDDLAARLQGGELALLLLDLNPMFGFAVPHWVMAHAADEGVILLTDPWISASWGETWVDAYELPVATAELDRMLAWGPDGYRGVIFIHQK